VRTHLVVVGSPGLDERLGVEKTREPVAVQAVIRNFPLKLSTYAFSTGLPGRMK